MKGGRFVRFWGKFTGMQEAEWLFRSIPMHVGHDASVLFQCWQHSLNEHYSCCIMSTGARSVEQSLTG